MSAARKTRRRREMEARADAMGLRLEVEMRDWGPGGTLTRVGWTLRLADRSVLHDVYFRTLDDVEAALDERAVLVPIRGDAA